MNQMLNKTCANLIVAADLDTEFGLPGIGEIPENRNSLLSPEVSVWYQLYVVRRF